MPLYPENYAPILPAAMRENGYAAPSLVLVDVGCSGGLPSVWNAYLGHLAAHGVDPLIAEIERLKREDLREGMNYYDGFITGPNGASDPNSSLWFARSSSAAAHEIKARDHTREAYNQGQPVEFSSKRFTIDEMCAEHGIERVDFIKSDTDGSDSCVLRGAEKTLKNCLAVLVECSFAQTLRGGALLSDIDAFMREQGFHLAHMAVQHYTRAALPGRFIYPSILAQTVEGAANWADALYLKDVTRDGVRDLDTLLRFSMLCETFNLPDVAAEALVSVRAEHEAIVTPLLDALVRYSGNPEAPSYDAMMAAFREDPSSFAVREPESASSPAPEPSEQLESPPEEEPQQEPT